ncbi:MAG: hypothetical protein V4555_05790, partial [Acidobacteriota bacterium]
MCGSARADELLVNGGFETGDFTGWTVANNDSFTTVTAADGIFVPTGGTYFAEFGTQGSDATVSQTFTDTVGEYLTLTFFLN